MVMTSSRTAYFAWRAGAARIDGAGNRFVWLPRLVAYRPPLAQAARER
jgi:hypothetical protein